MKIDKLKILYVMSSPPSYALYADRPRPLVNWDTSDGKWVGIWGYDWGDLLGNAVLMHSDKIDFEVLQLDLRADRVYEHCFSNGLKHLLFPAYRINQYGKTGLVSGSLFDYIEKTSRQTQVVLNIGANGVFAWLIAKKFTNLPIIGTWHGTIDLPFQEIFHLRKNVLKSFAYLRMHNLFKEAVKNFDLITYQNDENLISLERFYKGPLEKITMGVDFDEFFPRDKKSAREKLNLPLNKKVFLTISRLNTSKQIDKLIKVFNSLNPNFDFLLIIAGHGSGKYEKYIHELAKPLIDRDKILFPGYIRGKQLVNYYNAADLFMMVSKSEAGPVVSMEALACDIPIMTTDTGRVAEVLRENNTGIIVGKKSYKEWKDRIIRVIMGSQIQKLDYALAKQLFSWPNIAFRFINSYKYATRKKYCQNPNLKRSPASMI